MHLARLVAAIVGLRDRCRRSLPPARSRWSPPMNLKVCAEQEQASSDSRADSERTARAARSDGRADADRQQSRDGDRGGDADQFSARPESAQCVYCGAVHPRASLAGAGRIDPEDARAARAAGLCALRRAPAGVRSARSSPRCCRRDCAQPLAAADGRSFAGRRGRLSEPRRSGDAGAAAPPEAAIGGATPPQTQSCPPSSR